VRWQCRFLNISAVPESLDGSIFAMAEVRHEIDELIPRLDVEAGKVGNHLTLNDFPSIWSQRI
jgi:hypothetical protein